MKRWAVCCVVMLCWPTLATAADKAPAKKPAARQPLKRPPKQPVKPRAHAKAPAKRAAKSSPEASRKRSQKTVKAPAKRPAKPVRSTTASAALRARSAAYKPRFAPTPKLTGKRETLTCRDGTEDRHARIGVVLIGGKVDSFAYYSKWKPRTCSIYLQRNRDHYSRWLDKGRVTNVSMEHGLFLIEQEKGAYRFVFRDIDRERFCGMDGKINGTLTIRKGSERCEVAGIMEEGVPLGEAFAHPEQGSTVSTPEAVAVSDAPSAAPGKRFSWWGWWRRSDSGTTFPTASDMPSD